jgi:vacuolar-type H+-ATPase subunit I/STV1
MIKYLDPIEQLPSEFKLPIMKAFELFREEIAETVKRSDFEELKSVVEELAEAQKRTEERVEELAEAQKETQKGLTALTEDVRALTADIRDLTRSHKNLKELVGGLSHTVGYRLEDESYKALPALLKQNMDVEVVGSLKRDFIEIAKGRYAEINIFGKARYNGKECLIVGEAKTQLKRKDVDEFIKRTEELKRFLPKEMIMILVTYQASPQVQEYTKAKGIRVFFSYEF